MTLLAMSEEKMELLGLSDEAKEFQRQQNQAIQRMNLELAESKKEQRAVNVANKLAQYKSEKLDAFPGLLREFETTALSDDGDIAVELHLSENGVETTRVETATQIAERFIAALPRDKNGAVSLGEFANKLETPMTDRPADKPDDPNIKEKPKTGADLADEWAQADPSLAKDPLILALSENGGK